jgi:hypothetical protein
MAKNEAYSAIEEKPVFFFIPDISGFTNFMSQVNLQAGAAFMRDLLESIIDSNIYKLQVSEIQGDAILFYKFGQPLTLGELEKQTIKTFTDFQQVLSGLAATYNFPAKIFKDVSLKFVVHYGHVGTALLKGMLKLIGTDMIIANKVLKNNISGNEYLLMTEEYLSTQNMDQLYLKNSFGWEDIQAGSCIYEGIGLVKYQFVDLASLREPLVG